MQKQPNKNALYEIKKSPYGDGKQVVLHVTDMFRNGYLCFDDTNRGHSIQGTIISVRENGFSFVDLKNCEWEFEEVTIEYFRTDLYKYVLNGDNIAKSCSSTEDLWNYYRKEYPI